MEADMILLKYDKYMRGLDLGLARPAGIQSTQLPPRHRQQLLCLRRRLRCIADTIHKHKNMIIRVRTHAGVWRVNDLTPESTIEELRKRLQNEHNVADLSSEEGAAKQPLTLKPRSAAATGGGDGSAAGDALPFTATLGSLGLQHGDMVHLHLSGSIRDLAHEVRP